MVDSLRFSREATIGGGEKNKKENQGACLWRCDDRMKCVLRLHGTMMCDDECNEQGKTAETIEEHQCVHLT